jgi:hypothetical protein
MTCLRLKNGDLGLSSSDCKIICLKKIGWTKQRYNEFVRCSQILGARHK